MLDIAGKNRLNFIIFCVCIFSTSIMEIFGFLISDWIGYQFSLEHPLFFYFILPSFLLYNLLLVVIVLYSFMKKYAKLTSYMLLIAFVLLATLIILVHYTVATIYAVLILPLFMSIVFADRKMTAFISGCTFLSYLSIVLFYLPTRNPEVYRHDFMDISVMILLFIISVVVSIKASGNLQALIICMNDMACRETVLAQAAKKDSLTNLYNQAAFYEFLDIAIMSHITNNRPFSILVLDIDHFKRINDTYGHSIGDLVLIALSKIISTHTCGDDRAFRYGGDEFAILTYQEMEGAYDLAEIIRKEFSQSTIEHALDARLAVSIGVNAYSNEYNGKREFFASADRALYRAKQAGRNIAIKAGAQYDSK